MALCRGGGRRRLGLRGILKWYSLFSFGCGIFWGIFLSFALEAGDGDRSWR